MGDRVELNAMTSSQFIAWLEGKLAEQGGGKVVPDDGALATPHQMQVLKRKRQGRTDVALEAIDAEDDAEVPADLADQIRAAIEGKPIAWDEALWRYV